MKKKQIGTLLFALAFATCLSAQPVITVEMPEFANRTLVVTLKKGLRSDTVFNNKLDSKGLAAIRLPMSEAGFSGMATLSFSPQEGMDFIINRASFTVRNRGKDFVPTNIQVVHSEENTQFLAWIYARRQHDQKTFALLQFSSLYQPEDAFYADLTAEKERLASSKPNMMYNPDWYAPRFAHLVDFLSGPLANLPKSHGEIDDTTAVRTGFVGLNIETLYTSGLWFKIIDGVLAVYQPEASFHNSFGRDVSSILARTESLAVYEAFASDMLMICQQFGWDRAQDEIVNFLLNDQRIKNPDNERLKALIAIAATAPGNTAQPIGGIDRFSDGNNKTLLLFYDSGCEICREVVNDLKLQYQFFTENNVRVISISADTQEEVFNTYAKSFPWKDKISDFKGFGDGNFKTYGVMATPTMFLLDKDDKIISRFSNVKEVIEALKK